MSTTSDAARAAFDDVYGDKPSDLQPAGVDLAPAPKDAPSETSGDFARTLVLTDTERAIMAGFHPQPMFEVDIDPAHSPVASLPPVFPGEAAASGLESERLLSPPVAAEWLGVSVHSLTQMRKRETGPAYYKMGPTKTSPIRYMIRDLVMWREKKRHGSSQS